MARAAAAAARVVKRAAPSWAVSFADLGLLLLGCFVMLHAIEAARPDAAAVPLPATPVSQIETLDAAELFEPGEARLRFGAAEQLRGVAQRLPAGSVELVSRGTGEGGSRLDRFELAAARAASVSRALQAAGIADQRLTLQVADSPEAGRGQRIELRRR